MDNNTQPQSERKLPRLTVNLPLEYSISDNISIYLDEIEIKKGTKDFSILGLCIPASKEYRKDALVELELKFPEVKVKAMGKVAWSRYSDNTKEYFIGVRFIAIEDKYLDTVLEYYIDNLNWKGKEGKTFLKKILMDIFLENIM